MLAALLCALVGALSANRVLLAFDEHRAAARDGLGPPQRCALEGRVARQPIVVGGKTHSVVEITSAECESGTIGAGTLVRLAGGPDAIARGDGVAAVAQLAPVELLFNADLPSPLPFAAKRRVVLSGTALTLEVERRASGPFSWIDQARAHVRRRILVTFAPGAQSLARALVLGENDLDPDDAAAFRRSGLAHMLAVSGTHLVFAVISVVRALTALLVRVEALAARYDVGRLAAAFGIPLSLLYADFAGGSGSAFRAAFMLSAAFTARAIGRAACPSRALAASVLLGWIADPLVAFDLSFLLSFAATGGLLLLGEPLARPCKRLRSRLGRMLGTSIATTLAAMLPCAPLLALLGADLTLAGVFANVIAAPLGETVALPLCLGHAIFSGWPALERGVGLVASGALLVVRQIAHESANQRWLAFPLPGPNGYQLALAFTLCAAIALNRSSAGFRLLRVWVVAALLGLALVEFGIRARGRPVGELGLTVMAVGQGDAALLDLPDGRSLLLDAGGAPAGGADPGERVVLPVLRARRRERVDVVVLSHPHPDHFGGALAVVRNVAVGQIWDTGQGAREGAGPIHAEILREAAARQIPVKYPPELCRGVHAFGAAQLRVVAPCPDAVPGRGANDNSFILHVRLGTRSALLTGDAELEAELELLQRSPGLIAADLLKVGHHGSRTSTSAAFAGAVSPRLATISVGARNRFGHPDAGVIERLEAAGCRVLRTDRHGSIAWTTAGNTMTVRTARAAREPPALTAAFLRGLVSGPP